ncbi:MAG: hypothetical protein KatS3mg082_1743 [Nitrospiraceae bacterium]|nr:MAG: hypothetical protein KatS3mg082_1743 [Nitrospiraceae bacterium]
MATLQQAIDRARSILNDRDGANYRYSDSDLLSFANDALDAIALVRPELFYSAAEITCIQDEIVQRFDVADSLGLVDILYVEGGGAVTKTERDVLNRIRPGWPLEAAGTAQHWMRLADDPNRFLIYPKAPANQKLVGLYVKKPPEYAANDTILLPDSYVQTIAKYIVAMAEGRNDEAAALARSAAFLEAFYNELGAAKQTSTAGQKALPQSVEK